jgi:hypothetical protein
LPGLVGTWAEDGVGCEGCHGPGSRHVNNPYQERVAVVRDNDLCLSCHLRDQVETVIAENGFVQHHDQYQTPFEAKKRVLECVDCHDPHATTKYAKGLGIRIECQDCHFDAAAYQKISDRRHAECVECHMPRPIQVAVADPAAFSGDMRTHLMAINPAAIAQFGQNGEWAGPYLALEFACKGCHHEDGRGPALEDARLIEVATGYHDRELAGSENEQE